MLLAYLLCIYLYIADGLESESERELFVGEVQKRLSPTLFDSDVISQWLFPYIEHKLLNIFRIFLSPSISHASALMLFEDYCSLVSRRSAQYRMVHDCDRVARETLCETFAIKIHSFQCSIPPAPIPLENSSILIHNFSKLRRWLSRIFFSHRHREKGVVQRDTVLFFSSK